MSSLRLTGLVGSHPLGALAAFGLLRIVSGMQQFKTPRLAWKLEQDWLAVLHITDLDVAEDQLKTRLLGALVERQQERAKEKFLTWSDDIKVEPQEFERILKEQVQVSSLQRREVVDFLVAFGSEVIHPPKGKVEPTELHMTSGRQKFLKLAREIADSLDSHRPIKRGENADAVRSEIEEAFARALFGSWRREDRLHSLGWDPSTEAIYALLATAPGDDEPYSERAAVWLAFEALPLFPSFPKGSRLQTRGFGFYDRSRWFSWPIWRSAISVNTLASLLALPELIKQYPEMENLGPQGIVAVYRSECKRVGSYRSTFGHAVLCAGKLPRTY